MAWGVGGCTSHKSPPPECGEWALRQKGDRVCLQTEKSLQGRRMPPGSAAPVSGPMQESGHVAGDGAQGVEQGSLHAGLQEQQVHMDLGHRRGLVGI